MSCHNWETGDIVLSTTEFRRVKTEFFETMNKRITLEFESVVRLYVALLAAGKGKRNFDWKTAFDALLQERTVSGYSSWGRTTQSTYDFRVLDEDLIKRKMLYKEENDPVTKVVTREKCAPRKPLKKDFPLFVLSKATRASGDYCEGTVTFNAVNRMVSWNVSENNHAVDRARESFVGSLFFKLLGTVKWTRGTGGCISGNDEHRRDNREAGGGANELKETFGPLGEQMKEREYGSILRRPARRTPKAKPAKTAAKVVAAR